MSTSGQRTTVGKTADATFTRDALITKAFQKIKILREGGTLNAEKLQAGIDGLNLIVREMDGIDPNLWTELAPIHVTLQADVGIYDAASGLPVNIKDLESVVYRDAQGRDSEPLKILTAEAYEKIENKLLSGIPQAVHLTNEIAVEQRRLYLWPVPSAITAQSKVLGTDNNSYKCVYPHTSALVTRPTTGANWKMVWELSSAAASAWAADTAYTTAESLRLVIRRPIFDFDFAENTPDIPPMLFRHLLYRLCDDLADDYPAEAQDREVYIGKAKGSLTDVFSNLRKKTNDIHNKVKFY